MLQRRRIAARICMGQGVAEIARLEGLAVERAVAIVRHPLIVRLALVWMAFLGRVRDGRGLEPLEAVGLMLAEHELETGNAPCANFLCKLWAFVGSPGRGLVQLVARRFCALALQDVVRPPREPADLFDPTTPAEKPEPSADALRARDARRAMLAEARRFGMGGGLDLRYLPRDWRRGIQESLFRKLAHALECRQAMLLLDRPSLPEPRPDPGPFPRPRFGRARYWAPPDTVSWRFIPADLPGAYPGAFPVTAKGRILPTTVDSAMLAVTLAYEPWAGEVAWPTAPARAWQKRQAQARASPQFA